MPARIPLPDAFAAAPFLARAASQEGIGATRLRGPDLDRAVWGVRSVLPAEESQLAKLRRKCDMFAVRMPPNTVFSHTTAARLIGIPLPLRLERDSDVHIAVPKPTRAPHAAGIRGHQLDLLSSDTRTVGEVAHTSPARTWCDLASMLTLLDLVAAGDYLLRERHPLATVEQLKFQAQRFIAHRGMSSIRAALPLLDGRAESPPESHLRVILFQGGLPTPRVNHELVLSETGLRVRIDLHFDEFNVHLEYQGDYHRSKDQWRKDMTRRSRLEAAEGYVMEINADDLRNPGELVARVRTVLVLRGWRQ